MLFCLFIVRPLLHGETGRDLLGILRFGVMILACALALGWSPTSDSATIWVQAGRTAVPIGVGCMAGWYFGGLQIGRLPDLGHVAMAGGGVLVLIGLNHLLFNPDASGRAALMDVALIAGALYAPMVGAFPRADLRGAALIAVRAVEAVGFAIWIALCLQIGENLTLGLPVLIAMTVLMMPVAERWEAARARG